jgi:NAD(P)-dependent dehydrogenase (short-subunit alcohol dehydrogenase family)
MSAHSCRSDPYRGQSHGRSCRALSRRRDQSPGNLLSFNSAIRKSAAVVNAYREKPICVLISNAGVMNIPTHTLSIDGPGMQLATNWLGPFLFTNLLISKPFAALSGARVVNVIRNCDAITSFRFSDWNLTGMSSPCWYNSCADRKTVSS